MRPQDLIDKYYADLDLARQTLLRHSGQVARLAREIAQSRPAGNLDIRFIEEAAWLHDIGMLHTSVPEFGCHGEASYLCHGLLGAEILRREGLPRHALVCERHIGVGLSIEDIKAQGLPLPLRDMRPQTTEEAIVAYADLFYSKKKARRKKVEEVRASLAKHGTGKLAVFENWHERFAL